MAISQYGVSSFQRTNIPRKARKRIDCPRSSVARDPCDPTSFAERGATRTMNTPAGRIEAPASIVE